MSADAVLAPIFESALPGRWDTHIAAIHEFWCSALLVKRGYRGEPRIRNSGSCRDRFSALARALSRTIAERFAEPPIDLIGRALKMARNSKTRSPGILDQQAALKCLQQNIAGFALSASESRGTDF